MSSDYEMTGFNSTNQEWHYFGLYQQQPEQVGLKAIAWKGLPLSKKQGSATTGKAPWELTYQVTIPEQQDGNVYVCRLRMAARMGYRYELVGQEGSHQINEVGPGMAGCIDFRNSNKDNHNLGLMVGGDLMSMQDNVVPGVTAQFQVKPTYYCGLTNYKKGPFVTSNAVSTPVKITFPEGLTTANIQAVGQLAVKRSSLSSY